MATARTTALLIGTLESCRQLEQQLELVPSRPVSLGWVVTDASGDDAEREALVLGPIESLELHCARRRPGVALVALPAAMKDLIASVRTRLRKMGIVERYMPTLPDQLAGIGPRTQVDVDLAALIDRPARAIDEQAVRSVIGGKRILITGAGGSIGSEMARMAARFGPAHLAMMDRTENALFEIDRQVARLNPALPRQALLHDVVDAPRTAQHVRDLRPDVVFHAAAHKHVPMMEEHPAAAVDNNFFGTRAIVEACLSADVERFILISTDKAVNATSIMGATKRLAELYVQDARRRTGAAYSAVRFGNVLGSSGSVLDVWAREIAQGGPVTVTDPRMTRYFMTINEAASLVIQAAALIDPAASSGEVFLLDMGQPVRIVDLAARFIRQHGFEPPGQLGIGGHDRHGHTAAGGVGGVGGVSIVFTGARPGEKLHESLAYDAEVMRRTSHPDIMVWEVPSVADGAMDRIVEALSAEGRPVDAAQLAALVRSLVAEPALQMAA